MPSTLGPIIKIKGKVDVDLSTQLSAPFVVLECNDGRTNVLEFYGDDYFNILKAEKDGIQEFFIAQVLKEDGEVLFAFTTFLERMLFGEIRKFDSIGPKLASLIVGQVGLEELYRLLCSGDDKLSKKITGLGPKKIIKLVAGLKTKKSKLVKLFEQGKYSEALKGAPVQTMVSRELSTELMNSLQKFGMKAADLQRVHLSLIENHPDFEQAALSTKVQMYIKEWAKLKSNKALPLS